MLPVKDSAYDGRRGYPLVNTTLIAMNTIIFFAGAAWPGLLAPGASSYNEVIYRLGMVPGHILAGRDLYTVFTSMFIHASLIHLLGNMFYLYVFGDNVELAMGKARYLAFYLASGVGATVFHLMSLTILPPGVVEGTVESTGVNPYLVPAVGASGAISGVLGAYLLIYPSSEIEVLTFWGYLPIPLRLPAAFYILVWFIYQLVLGLFTVVAGVQAGIAFWAHIGGFLTGMALTPILASKSGHGALTHSSAAA